MPENPYQSPATTPDDQPDVSLAAVTPNPVLRYPGGLIGVTFAGVVLGVLVMFMMSPAWKGEPPVWLNPFFVIGVGWFGSLVGLVFLLRGHPISNTARWVAAVIAFPICYVLYVPTCSMGAMVLITASMEDQISATISSAICFPVIFLTAAVCLRASLRRKQLVVTHEDNPAP